MNDIFMNIENNKISHPHRLLLNLSDKIDELKRSNKYVALSNLSKTLYYLMDHILYQIFKII